MRMKRVTVLVGAYSINPGKREIDIDLDAITRVREIEIRGERRFDVKFGNTSETLLEDPREDEQAP